MTKTKTKKIVWNVQKVNEEINAQLKLHKNRKQVHFQKLPLK